MPEFRELLDGYHRFRRNDYHRHRGRWEELAEGQQPPVMIIACCDSRVDPATVFDLLPGQAFVLRNVANIVPPFDVEAGLAGVRSAIEFGVTGLGVRHVVVMGHGACGGIKAALAGGDQGAPGHSHLDDWISLIDEPRDAVVANEAIADKQLALEQAAIRHSLANLRTFPYIAEREAAGKLKLHGCHFTIGEGRLLVLDEESGEFMID
ncbi:carbonic anhydrase [Sphingomicrobium aestuariivivum]|uniref:carbonic anhydrase n=1 Tax=Sphingomicrobium aestuariivivum TaxID=1582356 RepID=UPI001FD65CAB|nr:carbonic anhydrase [Sphingomicrobium aestuariivivum]MCJ8189856.1 carbonic anhydrase [Sphingomicrobium aestuariivivum]